MTMEEIYQKIWDLALVYQDKRGDVGHARTVTDFVIRLLETESGDREVVVPAAILHDIGWSQLSDAERLEIFADISMERESELRHKHQDEGVKLARKILESIQYDPDKIAEICEIISKHDTRSGFISANEGLVRDADKLWMYSLEVFTLDAERRKAFMTPNDWFDQLQAKVDSDKVFFSKSAKKIARSGLNKISKTLGVI